MVKFNLPKEKKFEIEVSAKISNGPAPEGHEGFGNTDGGWKKVTIIVKSRFLSWAKRKALTIAKNKDLPIKDGWYRHHVPLF